MPQKIKKAIILIGGLGTRFLPLSKVVTKEFWPLVDKPIIQYIIEEAIRAKVKEIIFVLRPKDRNIINYFQKNPRLEKILKKKKDIKLLAALKILQNLARQVLFSYVYQKQPLGDGHAVKQAEKLAKKEPCLVLFSDDVVEAKISCGQQLIKVFNQYQKPVIALARLPKEKLSSYGIVKTKKIAPHLYQIEGIVEKPSINKAPSNLAIVGKYIIDASVFNFLQKKITTKGEIRLSGIFNEMIKNGQTIYGYEFNGKWLECGNKLAYLKSNLYLSLKHPQFGKELKKFLNQEKLI
ncbi:MAG: UTP--glucose-1-phosphate uridylyltransferase [Minisyncoccales bacterium]